MGVVPALIGGAVASVAGGAISAGASKHAADVQADAARYSADVQGKIYDQTRNDLSPFVRAGQGALTNYASLLPGGLQLGPASTGSVFSGGSAPGLGNNPKTIQSPGPDGQMVEVPNPNYDPSKPSGETPPFALGPTAQSPFLTNVESYIPGSGVPLNAQLAGLNALSPGSANPDGLMTAARNFVPGASDTPDSTLSALRSFVPGGGTENPLLKTLNGLLGVPTTPAAKFGRGDVDDLISSYKEAVSASGKPEAEFLKSPEGQAFVTKRNNIINGLTDPEQLARFAGPDAAPDAQKAATWRLQNLAENKGAGDGAASIQSFLESTPGYKFTLDQGLKSTQNSFAAKGLANSGAALKGAATFATGLANNTYEDRLKDYLNSYNSQYTNTQNAYTSQAGQALNTYNTSFTNALNATNTGYNRAANAYGQQLDAAGNLITTGANAGAQVGSIGTQTGANVANSLTGGANATAAGIVGSSNAIANTISGVSNNALTAALYSGGSAPGPKGADGWATGTNYTASGMYGT